jgi:hypothetical protein
MSNLPPLPYPMAQCERPDCDHAQSEHSRVLGMACTVSDCGCARFVGPGIGELMAALDAYAQARR